MFIFLFRKFMQINAYLIRYALFEYLNMIFLKTCNTKKYWINASYQLMKLHDDIY